MTLKMYWKQFKTRYLYPIVDYWFWYTGGDEIVVWDTSKIKIISKQ